jgi:hypothetical protein
MYKDLLTVQKALPVLKDGNSIILMASMGSTRGAGFLGR